MVRNLTAMRSMKITHNLCKNKKVLPINRQVERNYMKNTIKENILG